MNLFLALAEELSDRGHSVIFFNLPEQESKIRDADFAFESIEPDYLPPGTLGQILRDMAAASPVAAMRLQGKFDYLRYEAILNRGPRLARNAGLNGMIVDQADAASGTVGDVLDLPWVSVSNGLCMNSEPSVPPFFTSWGYSTNRLAILRNRLTYTGLRVVTSKTKGLINKHRQRFKLPLQADMNSAFSPFAQICQQNKEFDFPRCALPENFHYVGPIRTKLSKSIEFPWERLDGRRVIYASLGTVVNQHRYIYRAIAEACEGTNAQLVISLGGAPVQDEHRTLPGSPLVVQFAPQRELLKRAALTITHAGMNTTLESLECGVPIVAIPITFEQPGIASRIRWTGTGEFMTLSAASPSRLQASISHVLGKARFGQAAKAMSEKIKATDGRVQAATIIEEVVACNGSGPLCRRRPSVIDPVGRPSIARSRQPV